MNPETHTCPICGYTWNHGCDGSHSCASILLERVNRLERWKSEASEVLGKINLPEVGREIGAQLGTDISSQILPWIIEAKSKLRVVVDQPSFIRAQDRYKALRLPDDVQMQAIFLEGWNGGLLAREVKLPLLKAADLYASVGRVPASATWGEIVGAINKFVQESYNVVEPTQGTK